MSDDLTKRMQKYFERECFALASGGVTSSHSQEPEPLTIEKLRAAMSAAGLPRTFEARSVETIKTHLNLFDRAKYEMSDPLGGEKNLFGMPFRTDPMIPEGVIVIKEAGRVVKVVAMTDEARGAAQDFADMVALASAYRGQPTP